MELVLFIIAVIVAVAYISAYFIGLHFLKQAVDKMQEIQDKEKEKNNGRS